MFVIYSYLAILLALMSRVGSTDTKRIDAIEEVLKQQSAQTLEQNERVRNLEETVQIQQAKISDLQTKVLTLTEKQHKSQMKISYLKRIIMNRGNKNVEGFDTQKPKSDGWRLQNETTGPSSKHEDVNASNGKRLLLPPSSGQTNGTVAFYAYSSHLEKTPGPHHILVFDVVKVNLQNGYNSFTGAFTVPVSGVYMFTYTIRVACHSAISFEIVKNNNPEGSVFIDTQNPNICDDDHASETIIMSANGGDVILIRTHSSYQPTGSIQSNQYGRCSFAGWLISSLEK